MQRALFAAVWLGSAVTLRLALADEIDTRIATIAAAGPQGAGSTAAREACRELATKGPEILPRLLAAMDTPNFVAANWYRAAYEQILARELAKTNAKFPREAYKSFVRGPQHAGRTRRLALELLDRAEPAFGQTFLPTLLDDPEFRDDAVATALKRGDDADVKGEKASAKRSYETAFQHARNTSQVSAAAAKLAALGEKVSIVDHLGFVIDWSLVGPFPAPGMSGYRTPFPPETSIDLAAVITTTDKKDVHWMRHQTADPFGTVDLVQALGPVNEAVGYAYTEVESPRNQEVQLRCSADDTLAVWLNGEKVFGRDMWLNGTRFDRFVTPVKLKAGRNRLLLKICQGPHHRDPAVGNAWTFQLRLCSADGEGLGLKASPPAGKQAFTARAGGGNANK